MEVNKKNIEEMIHFIRGMKVMLDFDLARIYGYETKAFNQQVNRNKDKFPNRYRFQLTYNELKDIVRSQIVTSGFWSSGVGGRAYLPYAFTEQGVYMLMTVLKGDLATKQSIALIDAFKQMKDYIICNDRLANSSEVLKLSIQVSDNTKAINEVVKENEIIKSKLGIVMDNFYDSSKYKHFLIKEGERIESDVAYKTIYKMAKRTIFIIDDYINIKTLYLLKSCNKAISITLITDNLANDGLNIAVLNDFILDTGMSITLIKNNKSFHDRYIVLDYGFAAFCIYHCGGSSKDGGKRITTISKIEDSTVYKEVIGKALRNEQLKL